MWVVMRLVMIRRILLTRVLLSATPLSPTPTAWKYLEAAPLSTESGDNEWGKYDTSVDGTAVGTGASNPALIVADLNEEPPLTGQAAHLCVALGFGGYGDWFLPSKDELNKMWLNLASGVDENSVSYTPVGGLMLTPTSRGARGSPTVPKASQPKARQ